jgi:hypothetical protein
VDNDLGYYTVTVPALLVEEAQIAEDFTAVIDTG